MSKTIKAIEDGGHAWAIVPMSELRELNIHHEISRYSYKKDDLAYLEEDCDLGTYCKALKEKGIDYKFDIQYIDGRCFVRNLPRYCASR